jgi:hypothetical protein
VSVRFYDGFDLCGFFPGALKYSGYNNGFNQGSLITGRDGLGQALWIENNAFGEVIYRVDLDPQNVWGFNMDWQWSSGAQPDMVWYTIGYLTTTLLSLQLRSDGSMSILGPSATELVNTSQTSTAFQPGEWSTLELVATFGTSGSVFLYKNGILAAHVTGVNFGTTLPTFLAFQQSGFGPPGQIIDNYVIFDGQPGAITGQYGRVRVLSSEPTADLQGGEWMPSVPGPSFAMVDDGPSTPTGSPDGDDTYLLAQATGPDAVFAMQGTQCTGLILALAWNACMRPDPTTATPEVDMVYLPTLSTLVVGSVDVVATGAFTSAPVACDNYFTYQQVVEINPNTGTNWQDVDILNGSFGVGAAANPQVRLTAFYLEKLQDLTGKPFSGCGGGSYAY